ncbi:MAG: rhomboid family intramembrane serine protease [Candidatus Nanohaloarchaea archaeon]|nr:rhomboid family intramembrane serine protease [Candidatus Nanohaloarchaea archaeon]
MERSNHYLALWISGLLIAVYIGQLLYPPLTELLVLRPATIAERPWTLLSSVFIHNPGDYMHLLNNLFFLVVFGTMLELFIGSRRFFLVFILGGIAANLSAFTLFDYTGLLGASGAISTVIAALAVYRPRKIGLFWGVPVPMWAALLGWIMTNLAGAGAASGIAYGAHLYGLGFGIVTGAVLRLRYREKEETEENEELRVDDDAIKRWEDRHLR